MRLFLAVVMVGVLLAATKAVAAPHDVYDVQLRHYAGGKYVEVDAPVLGDEPAVSYFYDPAGGDVAMREYEHIGGWVVSVDWPVGKNAPAVEVWFDVCGLGCGARK